MSTRGLYTFKGESQRNSWNVYNHSDNYPTGAAEAITRALDYAWPLPRYEADEFAAAFIAANKSYWRRRELEILRELEVIAIGSNLSDKTESVRRHLEFRARRDKLKADLENVRRYMKRDGGGGVRMMPQGKPLAVAEKNCCDIEYRYEIYMVGADSCADLHVKAFSIGGRFDSPMTEELIYIGNLAGFADWAKREEEKETADA